MSGITDEQIEAIAAKHLKYQEEGNEVSGVYAFARALLEAKPTTEKSCSNCEHRQIPSNGYCYMFRFCPQQVVQFGFCGQHKEDRPASPATAADWPRNTCSASRHAAQIARLMARGDLNWLEDAHHVAESITATCEALWKARSELLPAGTAPGHLDHLDAYDQTDLTARHTDVASRG